jgi:hypothetical protein
LWKKKILLNIGTKIYHYDKMSEKLQNTFILLELYIYSVMTVSTIWLDHPTPNCFEWHFGNFQSDFKNTFDFFNWEWVLKTDLHA